MKAGNMIRGGGVGFENARVCLILVVFCCLCVIASLTGVHDAFRVDNFPHQVLYSFQLHRVLFHQLCVARSSLVIVLIVLFSSARFAERLIGSARFAAFVVFVFFFSPLLLLSVALVFSCDPFAHTEGPLSLAFAILYLMKPMIPPLVTVGPLSDTSLLPLVSLTLLLPSLPWSLLHAAIGISAAAAWQSDLPPFPEMRTCWKRI